MRKLLKDIWEAKITIICFIAGMIMGTFGAKYFALAYENELMTNWLLKHEIKDYVADRIGESICLEN